MLPEQFETELLKTSQKIQESRAFCAYRQSTATIFAMSSWSQC